MPTLTITYTPDLRKYAVYQTWVTDVWENLYTHFSLDELILETFLLHMY